MHLPARLSSLFVMVSVCSALAGCATALHAVVSPMLDAGIQSAVNANATPESMGVSTAQHRGKTCAALKAEADALNIEKSKPEHEALIAKALGWHVDAINQVRAEQGCDNPAQARSAVAAQVAMYGFCWYSDIDSRKHFVSGVFRYADWYADMGGREQQQYTALLKSSYGQSAAAGLCQGEDSQPKAEAARQKTLSMYRFANVSNINVAFTPSTPPPKPQAVAAAPRPGTAAVAGAPRPASAPAATQGTFRAKFDAVTPAFAQSLGLPSPGGALVIETEKGSPAERAGLRPLDVVTEVGGQLVQTPADLQAIVGRMRPGYKAPLRVWRNKAMRNMVVEVSAGAPLAQTPAVAPPAPVAAAPVLPALVALPPPASTAAYCFARINDPPDPTVMSTVYETPLVNGAINYDTAKADLIDFQESLLSAGDKRFRPFPPEKAFCGAGNCVGIVEGGLFTSRQNTVVICKTSRAAAEQLWKQSLPGTEAASWKPKR